MTEPQAVLAPLSRSAVFLVVTVNPDQASRTRVREFCADLPGLVRTVGFRDLDAGLSCVVGFGARVWPDLFGITAATALHPFQAIRGHRHDAVATPGDVLFHVRARRQDLCFELSTQILAALRGAVTAVDEVQAFRYFDNRDLLGFVDGTENPTGEAATSAAIVGEDDPVFAGSSYVMVQKYLHDLDAWDALDVGAQERVIGRTKLSNVELDDDVAPASAHKVLTTITDADGRERKIVRDNMPFGSPAAGEFGTYFIGYASDPDVLEQMLRNMFLGDPPGTYDRILDFSRAVTGALFLAPSVPLLDQLADSPPPTSLTIGSLKGRTLP
ncbi:Dyp-type peroxidase [Pseudonocardia yunnanensis]|uniref:Dyp-type peroxidase n=1 Tax=Pseudonocardia yunnanensis TaxID=58107 RepID=A0ABW4F7J4_9PSEU